LHEKCKPVKLIYPVVRLKGKEEDKKWKVKINLDFYF
jgi:hypothetical protein